VAAWCVETHFFESFVQLGCPSNPSTPSPAARVRDRLREVHRASPGRLIEDVRRDSHALLFELADSCTDFAYPRLDPTVRLLPVSIPEFPLRHLARLSAR
jgi:hypothetical protein